MRQRVLLVKQLREEETVHARVGHLGDFHDRDGGMQHGDGDARQKARPDYGLPHGAVPGGTQRKHQPLVKRARLVNGFLQRLEEREVEALVAFDVCAASRQQHQVVEALRHLWVKVGRKQARRLVHRVGCPLVRGRDVQNLLPIVKRGDNFQRLGHLAASISSQQPTHLRVHLLHLLVHSGHRCHRSLPFHAGVSHARAASLRVPYPFHNQIRKCPRLLRVGVHKTFY
mmetsp:Transcript_24865/g.41571  ORF Transcript_24865/g.41571 Transcript_24865/m.41571 type:complete len:228 (+) Transcript_24865:575-1258(+)